MLLSVLPVTSLFAIDHTGSVMETMNSGGYTYAKIQDEQNQYWIAGNQVPVKVGDVVSFTEQMKMPGFKSKTLNRTFENLMFVSQISYGKQGTSTSYKHLKDSAVKSAMKVSGIQKLQDGYTVAELFAQKNKLQGKQVRLRGKVMKVSNGIMNSNWIHIQDGTGNAGSDDIIFRSSKTSHVGDIVQASGTLVLDQDFGYGYKYSVMVENASFQTE